MILDTVLVIVQVWVSPAVIVPVAVEDSIPMVVMQSPEAERLTRVRSRLNSSSAITYCPGPIVTSVQSALPGNSSGIGLLFVSQ